MASFVDDLLAVADFDFALDPLDGFEDLCAELAPERAAPVQAGPSPSTDTDMVHTSASANGADVQVAQSVQPVGRKKIQRSLVSARNAQKRFRERQKVRTSGHSASVLSDLKHMLFSGTRHTH